MWNWKNCGLLLTSLLLCACASSPAPVGRVVEVPKVDYGLVPENVLKRKPQPPGFWTRELFAPFDEK